MVVVKTVNKHATCSDQQNDFFFFLNRTLTVTALVKIDGCKFLPDCSLEPKLFSFQHTALAVYVGLYCSEHDVFSLHMFIELLPFHGPSERSICVDRGFVTSETSI